MKKHLLFMLCAPLAAMGEIAVGERRMGGNRPARSAIFGLIAGCLGIGRTNEPTHKSDRTNDLTHKSLQEEYGFAIRTDMSGAPLRDYHTTQTLPEAAKKKKAEQGINVCTRADEINYGKNDLTTILSLREYRTDGWWTVVIWAGKGAPRRLESLKDALEKPTYAPYLGRKSCPLAMPMTPLILPADDILVALDEYDGHIESKYQSLCQILHIKRSFGNEKPIVRIAADVEALKWSKHSRVHNWSIIRSREQAVSRGHWLFAERELCEATLKRA